MKKIFSILAVAVAVAACVKSDPVNVPADTNRAVRFTASNMMQFQTKATAIANGTQVGIYAGAPIGKDNVSYTVSMEENATSGTLAATAANSLLWAVGQTTQATKFLAVYPYAEVRDLLGENEADKYISYEISDAESVEYANVFLAAAASQAPGAGETPAGVALAFKHPFAKLVYNIDNQSDDYVAGLKISGIRRTGKLMFATGDITTTGEPVAADEAVALNANGANSYMTIAMPEAVAVNPVITVNMVSGAVYTFKLAEGIVLEAGKVYTANIKLTGGHGAEISDRSVLGTFTVAAWENVNSGNMSADASTPAAKWWYLEGNIDEIGGTTDGNWNKHIPFKCVSQYAWEVSFYYAGSADATNGFKIRYAASATDWEDAWGRDLVINADDITAEGYLVDNTSHDSGNVRISATGKYKIVFYPDTHDFHIYKITE